MNGVDAAYMFMAEVYKNLNRLSTDATKHMNVIEVIE